MQIPILNGIYADMAANFRVAYPRNMMPVAGQNGISQGVLKPTEGIVQLGAGPGIDRGGINWNGTCYRVMGTKLVSIAADGTTTTLGDVGGGGPVTIDYGFDRLAICSGHALYYWDGAALTAVVDPDLGLPIDLVWVDGYYMTTDGEYLVVTELSNPLSVSPTKYGSSEIDPDPVKALKKVHNEIFALNRYSLEVFQNVGGPNFPFQRVEGAHINKGAVGTKACAVYLGQVAFVGGGRNESPAVWLGGNGAASKLSSDEIDHILAGYTEAQLATAVVERRFDKGRDELFVHLHDQSLVYEASASNALGTPAWHRRTTSVVGDGRYRAQNFVWCYDKWLCGDPSAAVHGYLTEATSAHWGVVNGWDFSTPIVYGEGRGAIVHELELACITGNILLGVDPVVWSSYSVDGATWSTERAVHVGKQGERAKRITWTPHGYMNHWRVERFRGTSDAHIGVARLEARIEPLYV